MFAIRMSWLAVLLVSAGCKGLMPVHQTVVHNPFPQLARVAVAPFFNLTTQPPSVVDGRQFALAYYGQLQDVRGFEVVPVGVVEEAIKAHGLLMARGEDAQRLAQILGVDAVAVGAVTDFSPYYPPRCAMLVEWYAADAAFEPILPGFGLPWQTPEDEDLPDEIVFDAEFAAARAQIESGRPPPRSDVPPEGELPPPPAVPVVRHVATYHATDAKFTAALADYVFWRDDPRFGGPPAYLQRSDDFIRFCCYQHIHELLASRGGAKTQVVWPPWCGR